MSEPICECGHDIDCHYSCGCLRYEDDVDAYPCKCERFTDTRIAALEAELAEARKEIAEVAPYRGMYLRLVRRLENLKAEFLKLPNDRSSEFWEKRAKLEAIDAAIAAGKESGE